YNFPPNAPKYINSKESYFYKKTQILYLYSNAKSSIQAQKAAFVVEGYIDSILLHENGFKNALATGGTAFNVQHLNLLTRLDCEVIFCFDNDKSGMAANFRAVKVCFNAGFYKVKVAILQVRDERGKLCKDINEALLCRNTLPANILESSSTRISSLKGGQGGLNCEVAPLIPPLTPQAPDDAFKVARERATIDCMDSASAELSAQKAQSTREKLKFNYLSGYEFFIKWLYKNKDKQQAFNEIKAAISSCQNFYDKQEFLDTACKLTGVPSEYFTQDKIPTKQPKDDYGKLVASILHSEECAYIATELDLSFIPQHKQLQAFLQTGENKELSGFIEVKPLDSDSFYQHYCDLYLAHLTREQTKARAKKDLKLVLALSEKITQVQQDIAAQKAF
ncbi:toprim domain-containing protein, partial [Helicobacter sp.]|uniref:toprim domain-containing protein n=1 Tax=Helicobacter sp. TaxID=218 RepID=UPI00388FA355